MNIEIYGTNATSPFEVASQWRRSHGNAYSLRDADLKWNFEKQSLLEYFVDNVAGVPTIFAVATADGIKAGLARGNLWLSLWGEIRDGGEKKFAEELVGKLKASEKSKLVIGGEEFHFIPGIPESPAGKRLRAALEDLEFEGAESADYFGNINSTEVNAYATEATKLASGRKLIFSEVTSPSDFSTLTDFLNSEFPGRWAREFEIWKSREDTQRAFWKILRTQSSEVVGFARMAVRGRQMPLDQGWTPGALRMPTQFTDTDLVYPSDCCLGPIGVASSQRGKGTGKILLGLVLESLHRYKTERICIDWTNAFKYYEPLNLEIARRYWTAWISSSDR